MSRIQSSKFYFIVLALIFESGDHQTEESGLSVRIQTANSLHSIAYLFMHGASDGTK